MNFVENSPSKRKVNYFFFIKWIINFNFHKSAFFPPLFIYERFSFVYGFLKCVHSKRRKRNGQAVFFFICVDKNKNFCLFFHACAALRWLLRDYYDTLICLWSKDAGIEWNKRIVSIMQWSLCECLLCVWVQPCNAHKFTNQCTALAMRRSELLISVLHFHQWTLKTCAQVFPTSLKNWVQQVKRIL